MNKVDINKNKLEIGDIVVLCNCVEAISREFEFWEVYADNLFTNHSVFIRGLTSSKSDSFYCDCLKKVDKKYKELVDKATPKKPDFDQPFADEETTSIYDENGFISPVLCLCSHCGKKQIYDSEYDIKFKHCANCGGAIDWSDK